SSDVCSSDLLFYYGLTGLLLYFLRNLSARTLIVCATLTFLAQWGFTTYEYATYQNVKNAAEAAQNEYYNARELTPHDEAALNEYAELQGDFKPSQAQIERTIEEIRASYASAFRFMAHRTFYVQTAYFLRHGIGDVLSFMLLGMALLKMGVLTGTAPRRTYAWMALLGYALGLSVNAFETISFERAD